MRWSKDLTFEKDPSDVVDYVLNFGSLLQSDTIDTVTATATGVTVDAPVVNGSNVTIFVSGGTACTTATVTITITTTNSTPRVFERSFKIKIVQL